MLHIKHFSISLGNPLSDDDSESVSREASPCSESPRPVSIGSESPNENICTNSNQINNSSSNNSITKVTHSTGTNTQNSNVNNKISNHVMNNSASGRSLHSQNKSVGVSYPISLSLWPVISSFLPVSCSAVCCYVYFIPSRLGVCTLLIDERTKQVRYFRPCSGIVINKLRIRHDNTFFFATLDVAYCSCRHDRMYRRKH